MKNKKTIDRLFKEQFKDFEVEPKDVVWKNIELELREKKNKKRIIPFWYKLSGVAALLTLAFFVVYNGMNVEKQNESVVNIDDNIENASSAKNGENQNQNIGNSEKQDNLNLNETQNSKLNSIDKNSSINKNKNVVVTNSDENTKNKKLESNLKNTVAVKKNNSKNIENKNQNNIVYEKNKIISKNNTKNIENKNQNNIVYEKNKIISKNNKSDKKVLEIELVNNTKNKASKINLIPKNKLEENTENAIVANKNRSKKLKFNKANLSKKTNLAPSNNDDAIAANNQNSKDNISKNASIDFDKRTDINKDKFNTVDKKQIVSVDSKDNNNQVNNLEKDVLEKNNNSLISNNTIGKVIEDKKIDSIAIASKTPNVLEELALKKESEKKKVVPKTNKWLITSNIAPVFFNSNAKDSPIDPALNSYNKTFENNLSLGIGMGYAVSKKLTIRSGLNKFTMNYATNDILFRAGLGNPVAMQNMTSANVGAGLEILSKSSIVGVASTSEISPQNISEGAISQKMGYFEVPLEVSYAVLNKKFSIDLIGGFSTLFLQENEISMQTGSLSTNLGKASNLRDIHFSSNIGIGFRYQFWKSFQARLEPTFKYQINTFTDNSIGFKPYFIGVYSGISFGF